MEIDNKQRLDLAALVAAADRTVVAEFTAEWCPFCKQIAPVLAEIAREHAGEFEFVVVDTDERQDLAERYEIMTIPAVLVFRGGERVADAVGYHPKDFLLEMIFGGKD